MKRNIITENKMKNQMIHDQLIIFQKTINTIQSTYDDKLY